MGLLKKITKKAIKYITYKNYIDGIKTKELNSQEQSLAQFNISTNVEDELKQEKEAKRKVRNKRKAAKK